MAVPLESIIQPYSVTLEGNVNGQLFEGTWKYTQEDMEGLEDGNEPSEFSYKRSSTPHAIPSWQIGLMRGLPMEDVLKIWDPQPPDATSSTLTPEQEAAVTFQDPTESSPSWYGLWEGHFVLKKSGKDTKVSERFVLEAKEQTNGEGEDQSIAVRGSGSNTYGRFQLVGTFNNGKLVCDRAYVTMPRKKRKSYASTNPENVKARISQRIKDDPESTRKRRIPTKFIADLQDEFPQWEKKSQNKTPTSRVVQQASTSTTVTTTPSAVVAPSPRGQVQVQPPISIRHPPPPSEYEEIELFSSEDEGEDWRSAFLDEEASEIYEGEMVNDVREGYGIVVYCGMNNNMYEGEWANNKENGRGILMTSTRDVIYDGDFVDGKLNGQGTYHFSGGGIYTGDWRENMRHGKGTYTLPSGSRYEGEWKDGLRHGKGLFQWADGSFYDGDWLLDKRHGRGRLELASGLQYEGGWVSNHFDGRGVCVYPDGQKYEGMWKYGKKEGRGSMVFPNGASYEGRFREDIIDGQGTLLVTHPVAGEKEGDWMIPVQFQSDIGRIHAKAGFDKAGM